MMRKAQAFDTFQLMIAAVIAVAILGVLLTIMGQIVIPTQEPIPAMQSLLVDSYQYKVPKISTSEATFNEGELIPARELVSSAGGSNIKFEYNDQYEDAVDIVDEGKETEYLNPLRQFKAKITTCCTSGDCYVNIGETTYDLDCAKPEDAKEED